MGKGSEQTFLQKMANTLMKKCSVTLSIRETPIKTTVRWHFTSCQKVDRGSHKDSEEKNIQINFHCKVKELLQWRITGLNVNVMT